MMEEKEQNEITKLPSIFIYDEKMQVKLIITNHVEQLTEFLSSAFKTDEDFWLLFFTDSQDVKISFY